MCSILGYFRSSFWLSAGQMTVKVPRRLSSSSSRVPVAPTSPEGQVGEGVDQREARRAGGSVLASGAVSY